MIRWLYLIIIMYSSATKMHNSGAVPACMCHIWLHRPQPYIITSLLACHTGGMANLKYLIATHVPVPIANNDKCPLSVLAVPQGELNDELNSQSLPLIPFVCLSIWYCGHQYVFVILYILCKVENNRRNKKLIS
jgi:hypothetical protein